MARPRSGKTVGAPPGLADMHVHVWTEGDLLLYVANGVTMIRNMSGAQLHLEWRERIMGRTRPARARPTGGRHVTTRPPRYRRS